MIRSPKRWSMTAALLLAGGFAAGCGHPDGLVSPAVPPELKHSWETSFNRGDADAVVALYADDAELVMPGASPVHGLAAIRSAVSDMIKSGVKVKTDTTRNVGSTDVAYVYGTYVVSDAGAKVVEQGRFVETWERRAGSWKITVDINTAGPIEPGASPSTESAPPQKANP